MVKLLKIIPFKEYELEEKGLVLSKSKIPDWYKKIKPTYAGIKSFLLLNSPKDANATLKRCVPFLDAMSTGYMITLEQDVEVVLLDNQKPIIQWRSNSFNLVSVHTEESWKGLEVGDEFHKIAYKWENYLSLKTPKKYSLLFTHPINRMDLPFFTLSGIVDTDKYDIPVNFPFVLKKDFSGIIERGTPIAQIIPIKRESWVHKFKKYYKVDTSKKMNNFYSKIFRSYKNHYWSKKNYE